MFSSDIENEHWLEMVQYDQTKKSSKQSKEMIYVCLQETQIQYSFWLITFKKDFLFTFTLSLQHLHTQWESKHTLCYRSVEIIIYTIDTDKFNVFTEGSILIRSVVSPPPKKNIRWKGVNNYCKAPHFRCLQGSWLYAISIFNRCK